MDERRHRPGSEDDWEESWSFDFVSGDGAFGGFVGLALHQSGQRAWYWAYLARPGRPVVVVRDHDVEPPRTRELEVRGDGLWAQVICETPFEHWSAGLEASAVAIDDPVRAWGDERGDPVGLGLDLEWEMQAPACALPQPGYVQPATVHGEVLVGADRLTLDGIGWYTHAWGAPRWRDPRWWSVGATFDDGTALASRSSGWASTWRSDGAGRGPGAGETTGSLETQWRHDGLPGSALAVVGDAQMSVQPVAFAPVPLDGAGSLRRVLVRALCSFTRDGQAGWGWAEWRRPADSP